MSADKINPYIRYARPSVLSKTAHLFPRVIYDYEIIYIESGAIDLRYDNKKYECRGGEVLFFCPGAEHSFTVRDIVSQPHIHFDIAHRERSERIPISFKNIEQMSERERADIDKNVFGEYFTSPIIKVENKQEFLDIFYRIVSTDDKDDSLCKKGLLTQLLSIIIKDNFPDFFVERKSVYSVAKQIKERMDAGFGLDLNLDGFSAMFSYSKFHLEKLFCQDFGESIISYRNRARMKKAKELLKTNSVTKTAERLGYMSLYSFSRAYKLFYGVSPTKDRKSD